MIIDEMRASKGARGGWIVIVRPRREWAKFVSGYATSDCRKLASGRFWISESVLGDLKRHNANAGGDTKQERQKAPPPPPPSQPAPLSCFGALYVRDNAPWEVVTAAYRALTKLCHPDMPGGSHERMKRLNLAFEACEVKRGKKVKQQ